MDGLWLNAPSGILDVNSDPKPVYHALHKKIKGEWWMNEQAFVSDENGCVTVEGFKGDYLAVCDGKEVEFAIL